MADQRAFVLRKQTSYAHSLNLGLIGLGLVFFLSGPAFAGNKVDLEDLTIKGELINDDRMHLTSREAQQMSEKITYRKDFRPEMLDGIELEWPDAQSVGREQNSTRSPSAVRATDVK